MTPPQTRLIATALTFAVCFALAFAWLRPLCMLFDTDSYYHLAVARAYAQHGLISELPWARFSAMRFGFGDKELLFHLLLAPFAGSADPLLGGKLALAGLVAALSTALVRAAWPAIGWSSLYVPLILVGGALSFDLRIIRLRPELLALLLILGTLAALSAQRHARVFVLSFAFAWSYTAVHALVGLCAVCFLYALWCERKPRYAMLVAPLSGAVAGLLSHPHFPHNLRIAYLQNVVFWRYRDQSDIGDEILPLGITRFLEFDWPALLALLILYLALTRVAGAPRSPLTAAARNYTVAAVGFGALFVTGGRFAIYAWPFALLAAAHQLAARGYRIAPRLERVAGTRAHAERTWLVLLVWALVAGYHTVQRLTHFADLGGCIWPAQLRQLEQLGRAVPPGAKIAAPWTVSDEYVFFAPQGRYLNLLDPVFMRSAHPEAYLLQRALFRGELPDVPLALVDLDSDYLAFTARILQPLAAQIRQDPRLTPVVEHGQVLYRLRPGENRDFVLDYRVADTRAALRDTQTTYPRAAEPRARAVEGIVDGQRLGAAGRCVWLEPQAQLTPGTRWEVASTGTLSLFRGPDWQLDIPARPRLILGDGTRFEPPEPSPEPVVLKLCSGETPASFYLLRR